MPHNVKNRVPIKAVEKKVPYETPGGRKPPAGYLRIFGCDAYAFVPKVNRKKLDSRSKKVTFVGYDLRSKSYRLWLFEKNRLIMSRDVRFIEESFVDRVVRQPSKEEEQSVLELKLETTSEVPETESDVQIQVESEENSEASNTNSDYTVPQADISQGHRPSRTCVQPAWMRSDSFLVGDELYEH